MNNYIKFGDKEKEVFSSLTQFCIMQDGCDKCPLADFCEDELAEGVTIADFFLYLIEESL